MRLKLACCIPREERAWAGYFGSRQTSLLFSSLLFLSLRTKWLRCIHSLFAPSFNQISAFSLLFLPAQLRKDHYEHVLSRQSIIQPTCLSILCVYISPAVNTIPYHAMPCHALYHEPPPPQVAQQLAIRHSCLVVGLLHTIQVKLYVFFSPSQPIFCSTFPGSTSDLGDGGCVHQGRVW